MLDGNAKADSFVESSEKTLAHKHIWCNHSGRGAKLLVLFCLTILIIASFTIAVHAGITDQPQKLRTSGTRIVDGNGNPVTLVSVNVDHNEYSKGFLTAQDIARMQAHGGNCLELNGLGLKAMMPTRGSISSSYLQKLDNLVNLCENAKMYVIINFADLSYTSWGDGMPNWMLDGHGYGTAPYSSTTVNLATLDFFDTDKTVQNDNRQSFIDLWEYIANRYKDKQYAMFSIMNEPFSHCPITSRTQSQHMGITYSRYMEQVVDAIHTVANNLIFIDKPFVWFTFTDVRDVQPVNRDGIVWEDHLYVCSSWGSSCPSTVANWKTGIDTHIARYMTAFGKPFYVGEYGPYPTNRADWQSVFGQQVAYLRGKVAGYAWHQWGTLNGEVYTRDNPSGAFNAQDSETLLSIVYPPAPTNVELTILPTTEKGWTSPSAGTYTYASGSTVSITAYNNAGWQFSYWSLDGANAGSANPLKLTMNANHAIQAMYIPQAVQYQLTINSATGGTTNPAGGNHSYTSGATATVTATPSPGYAFDHWTLDGASAGSGTSINVIMNANHVLTPVFAPTTINYKLSVNLTGGKGWTSPSAGTYTYASGSTVSLTAYSNAGYKFSYWSVDGVNAGSANPLKLTMNANHVIQAMYVASTPTKYTLTVLLTGGRGWTNPLPGTYTYNSGSIVSITAYSNLGYKFSYWSLDGINVGSANPFSITMNGNHTIQSKYVAIP